MLSMCLTFDWSTSQSYFPTLPPVYVPLTPSTPPVPSPYIFSPLPVPLPTSNSIFACNPRFILSSLPISLQEKGYTALIKASENGHSEAIKALLTAPGIDVNLVSVSLYLQTSPYLVVSGEGEGHILLEYIEMVDTIWWTVIPSMWLTFDSSTSQSHFSPLTSYMCPIDPPSPLAWPP